MKENLRKEKGITLIALVVTIVVLIILAGVSINLVLGDNGIIAKARYARTETEQAKLNEEIAMNELMESWDDLVGGTTDKTEIGGAEKYYGDASIVPSPAEIFMFTVDETTQTASVGIAYNAWDCEIIDGKMYYNFQLNYNQEHVNGKTYYSLKYNGEELKELVIPYECEKNGKKYLVTSIQKKGFEAASSYVEKIIIPSSIQSIGESAFSYNGITELTIPNSVTNIENMAFWGCSNLKTVIFEMTAAPEFGYSCFDNDSSYNPETTTFYFKNKTVYEALVPGTHYNSSYGVKSADFIGGTEIGDAKEYYGDASIVPSPAELFEFTINEITQTASVRIQSSRTESIYNNEASKHYYSLKYNGVELKELIIPYECEKDGKKYLVTSIENYGFDRSSSYVEKIIIPSSINFLGNYAFSHCDGLTNITIPNCVKNIGYYAFGGCASLTEVRFEMTTAPTFGSECFYKYSGYKTTFYFKNSTVANALVEGTHYNATYGTKSDDYNW